MTQCLPWLGADYEDVWKVNDLVQKTLFLVMKNLMWGGLSSIQWFGYPSRLPASEDRASKITKEGKERDGRGILTLICHHQSDVLCQFVYLCARIKSLGSNLVAGKHGLGRRHGGEHSILFAMMCKEWNNQEIHFRKILLRMCIDGCEQGEN